MFSLSIWVFLIIPLLLPVSNALHITNHTIDKFILSNYDYVVVGGGLSGLVVANRLSENPNTTVLIIEAGELDRREDFIVTPGYIGRSHPTPYGHSLTTTPQTFLDGKTRNISQGKVIGGGSVMNGMCWTRGSAADFNAWEELGNPGWGWDGLLPYFKKVERYTTNVDEARRNSSNIHPDMAVHGTDGLVDVAYPQYFYNQSDNVLRGLSEIGIAISRDVNAGDPTGAMIVPSSMSPTNQTRSDARTGYFDSSIHRPNLHVVTGHTATRLLVGLPDSTGRREKLRILGVEFISGSSSLVRAVTTNREVVLAAGAIQSPILMQVSGIGPRQVLESLNITVQMDLAGVGNNFQDHPMVQFPFEYSNSSVFTSQDLTGDDFTAALDTFLVNKTGPMTAPLINTIAFPSLLNHLESRPLISQARNQSFDFLPVDTPPAVREGYLRQRRLLLSHLSRKDVGAYELLAASWGQISIASQKPLSRGTVRPSSPSAFDAPLVDPRYCADPLDCAIIRLGLQLSQKLMRTAAMAPLLPVIDAQFSSADEGALVEALKARVGTEYHPSGTTSMMPRDLGGVVSPELKVYGTCNLRVVDAGVMPMIPGGHIQAAVYAVAEKAADIIKASRSDDCAGGRPKWPPVQKKARARR
ncbi:Dehydrogenase xptC [Colletotrichum trifolii]|uniref:Dehydrogenase xptC n=1 Tax=Colletotrichum trifolii TaxID=5466 RepID=A0A4R8RF40_COLTR|nr:Dehydrogenase xptC [Colletotrichum trifolii]